MESIPPSKRNTQADIQLRTRQTNHQQETDGCIQIKHNPEHQPSRMSSKSTSSTTPWMSMSTKYTSSTSKGAVKLKCIYPLEQDGPTEAGQRRLATSGCSGCMSRALTQCSALTIVHVNPHTCSRSMPTDSIQPIVAPFLTPLFFRLMQVHVILSR